MPTLTELRQQWIADQDGPHLRIRAADEELTVDPRARLSPAQIVDRRLRAMLSAADARLQTRCGPFR
jgi:hypothetical protein